MAALGNRATGDQGENIGICGQIIIWGNPRKSGC